MKNKYILLRHGQTENNVSKIVYTQEENLKKGLTKQGAFQIRKAAKELEKEKIDLIFSSDYFRTRQTALIVAKKLNLKVIYDKRLREIETGTFEGLSDKKYHNFYNNNSLKRFKKAVPKGESLNDVKKRMKSFFKNIEKKYLNKKILVVGHCDCLWMLAGIMQKLDNEEIAKQKDKLHMRPGEWKRF